MANAAGESMNHYRQCRESCGYTRAEASEKLGWITESRLEKIENGKYPITPEEVVAMQTVYNKPNLCNYYCTHACAIGEAMRVQEVRERSISEIVLEVLAALNRLQKQRDRLIEITSDGRIDDDGELKDFIAIQKDLEQITASLGSLKLWVDAVVASGEVDAEKFDRYFRADTE